MKSFRQYTEEIKPELPQDNEEDSDVKSKEKRQKQIKKMVLMKKLQAVRAGAGADIVAGYEPEGESLDERTLSSYIPSDRQGEARRANLDYMKAQLKKKEDESTKNRGDLSKRDAGKMAKERLHNKEVMSMGEDKAFNFVLDKIRKEVGKDGYVSKNNPRKPQSAADKAKVRSQQAKVDAENAAERKKDPSQGRYPKG